MRILRVEIQNFRGVSTGRVEFPGHALLVGPNNACKSTVLEALDLALGPERAGGPNAVDEPGNTPPTLISKVIAQGSGPSGRPSSRFGQPATGNQPVGRSDLSARSDTIRARCRGEPVRKPDLTDDEQSGIHTALESVRAGKTVSLEDAKARVDRILDR